MNDGPQRIQRKRTTGWRMPEGAIYVGRPTRWGNPFVITEAVSRREAVEMYRRAVNAGSPDVPTLADIRAALRGHDLACWCPGAQICHADVRLELANRC